MLYSALIVDIKNSRKLAKDDRHDYQIKMHGALDFLNKLFDKEIKYKVVFSLGDSVQGMFYTASAAYLYFLYLETLVYPLSIRGGIGIGDISIDIKEFDSNMQDGPAYYHAREALEICHERRLDLIVFGTKNDLYINEMLKVISLLRNGSKKRKDIANLVNLIYPYGIERINRNEYSLLISNYILSNIKNYDRINSRNIDFKIEYDFKDDHEIILPTVSIPTSLSQTISEILGTSRENIRQMIESGEMNQIRNLIIIIDKLFK
jgi:hypothetical protein